MFRLLQMPRETFYALPIQARLIPDCKDSLFTLFILKISTLFLFFRRIGLPVSGMEKFHVVGFIFTFFLRESLQQQMTKTT